MLANCNRLSCACRLRTVTLSSRTPSDSSMVNTEMKNPSLRSLMTFAGEAQALSSFLSESRVKIEQTHRVCSSVGCNYVCTGLLPSHCCRLCASSAGKHGPRCQKRHLRCATPGCAFLCTGISSSHCCRLCAHGEGHGHLCKQVSGLGIGDAWHGVPSCSDEEEITAYTEPVSEKRRGREEHVVAPAWYASDNVSNAVHQGVDGSSDDTKLIPILDEQIEANEELLGAQQKKIAALRMRIQELELERL
ncbi:MAG: hypothetical protein SGPRY_013973 [Prymnesium sp.]